MQTPPRLLFPLVFLLEKLRKRDVGFEVEKRQETRNKLKLHNAFPFLFLKRAFRFQEKERNFNARFHLKPIPFQQDPLISVKSNNKWKKRSGAEPPRASPAPVYSTSRASAPAEHPARALPSGFGGPIEGNEGAGRGRYCWGGMAGKSLEGRRRCWLTPGRCEALPGVG